MTIHIVFSIALRPLAAAVGVIHLIAIAAVPVPWDGDAVPFVVALVVFGILAPAVVALGGATSPRAVLTLMLPSLIVGGLVAGAPVDVPRLVSWTALAVTIAVLVLAVLVQADETPTRREDNF